MPLDPPAPDEPRNDVGHELVCCCPACLPEAYPPAIAREHLAPIDLDPEPSYAWTL